MLWLGFSVSKGFWNTIWIEATVRVSRRSMLRPPISRLPRVTVPSVAVSRPSRTLARVDLPQPLSPTMASVSPSRASKLTASLALTTRVSPPKSALDADPVVLLQPVDGEHHVAERRIGDAGAFGRGRRPVDLVPADAAGGVAGAHRLHGDVPRVAAALDEMAAARPEVAAGRALVGQGEVPRDGDERPAGLVRAGQGDRAEESLGIGVAHLIEDLCDRPGLDRLARVHHRDAVAGFQHQAEVVADEEHRRAEVAPEVLDQIDDPGLHGDVERRRRLVEDQERRPRHQRHGDDDALLLSAGELVRDSCRGSARDRAGGPPPPPAAPARARPPPRRRHGPSALP